MNENLIIILKNLKSDPTQVVLLYERLYKSNFIALVRPNTEGQLNTMEFLTYPTVDEIGELPIFTSSQYVYDFGQAHPILIELLGKDLWPKLSDIIKTGTLEVAVDPGQDHGIRLTTEMILGMISMYAED